VVTTLIGTTGLVDPFVLFTTKYLFITLWIRTVDIAFARLTSKVITSNDDMFKLVDWNGNPFVEHIALAIPKGTLRILILA